MNKVYILIIGVVLIFALIALLAYNASRKIAVSNIYISKLDSVGLSSVSFSGNLELANPTILPVQVMGAEADIQLSGKKVGQTSIGPGRLPARGLTNLSYTAKLDTVGSVLSLVQGWQEKKLDLVAKGTVRVKFLFWTLDVPFEKRPVISAK